MRTLTTATAALTILTAVLSTIPVSVTGHSQEQMAAELEVSGATPIAKIIIVPEDKALMTARASVKGGIDVTWAIPENAQCNRATREHLRRCVLYPMSRVLRGWKSTGGGWGTELQGGYRFADLIPSADLVFIIAEYKVLLTERPDRSAAEDILLGHAHVNIVPDPSSPDLPLAPTPPRSPGCIEINNREVCPEEERDEVAFIPWVPANGLVRIFVSGWRTVGETRFRLLTRNVGPGESGNIHEGVIGRIL